MVGIDKDGKVKETMQLFQHMGTRCTPNVITYISILNLCKNNEVDLPFKIMQEIVEYGCSPEGITYNYNMPTDI